MKKCVRVAIKEIKKKCTNPVTFFCMLAIMVLCFTGVVATSASNGKSYTCIDILINADLRKRYGVTSLQMIAAAISPYMTMFVPLVASVPYVLSLDEERRKNNILFRLIRIDKKTYFISEYLSAVISAGVTVFGGMILYSFIVFAAFGSLPAPDLFLSYIKIFAGSFIYGMNSVQLAFAFSAFIENKFICCTLPYALTYAFYTFLSMITAVALKNGQFELFVKIQALYKSNLVYVFEKNDYLKITVIYALIIQVFSIVMYIAIWSKKNK